jgi:hypothetical protein
LPKVKWSCVAALENARLFSVCTVCVHGCGWLGGLCTFIGELTSDGPSVLGDAVRAYWVGGMGT